MNLDTHLEAGVSLVFATPILLRRFVGTETVNARLREAILKAEREDKGHGGSNVGGWQSTPTLLDWPIPEIAKLKEWLDEAIVHLACLPDERASRVEYSAYAWANLIRNGGYNRTHDHGDIHWASVYYVDRGAPEPGHPMNGKIELRDPRPGASIGGNLRYPGYTFGQGLIIDPEPGMFLMFPGWIEHFVHPFFGQGERISVAINVTVKRVNGTLTR